MASSKELFRQLSKELKIIHKRGKLQDVPIYSFMESEFRRFQVTGEKECRGQNEAMHRASTYLCMLQSKRKLEELRVRYQGRGERSIEDSARLVGLRLPITHTDLPPSVQDK